MSTTPSPFDPASLSKAVHDSLDAAYAAIPDGKNNAVILDGTYDQTDGPQMRALFVHRLSGNWAVAAEGDYDGPHGVSGKVSTEIVW